MFDGEPDGWEQATLGEIITLEYGRALPEASRLNGDVPVYGSNGPVGAHARYLVPERGIVVGRKGTAGSVHVTSGAFWPIDTTYYVRPRREADFDWLAAILRHADLGALNEATGVPGLNRENAYRQPVLVPPLDEQRRIAEVLRSVDEAIAAGQAEAASALKVLGAARDDLIQRARIDFPEITVAAALAKNRGEKRRKLQTAAYQEAGRHPIIDQGAEFICGYTDDEEALWPYALPVIVFGDHTRALKFVDFPFVIGADGTQCLTAKEGVLPRYLYFAIQSLDLRSEGYARHFKLLKEQTIPLPDECTQREIAETLVALEHAHELATRSVKRTEIIKKSIVSDLLSGRVRVPA